MAKRNSLVFVVLLIAMGISADRAVAGQIKNGNNCLTATEKDDEILVQLSPCAGSPNQNWDCKKDEIRIFKQCLGVAANGLPNIVMPCKKENPRRGWEFPLGKQGGIIKAIRRDQCLQAEGNNVILRECTKGFKISSEKLQHEAEKLTKKLKDETPPENLDEHMNELNDVVKKLQSLTDRKFATEKELLKSAKTEINNNDLFNKYQALISNSIEVIPFPIPAQKWFIN